VRRPNESTQKSPPRRTNTDYQAKSTAFTPLVNNAGLRLEKRSLRPIDATQSKLFKDKRSVVRLGSSGNSNSFSVHLNSQSVYSSA